MRQASRKQIVWSKTQPLSFIQLLQPSSRINQLSGGAVWRLALVFGLQKGTNKGVEQQLNVFTKERLAWTAVELSQYKLVEGLAGFTSGRLVGPLLSRFGKRWGVMIGNLTSSAAWLVIGTARSSAQVLGGQAMMGAFGPVQPTLPSSSPSHTHTPANTHTRVPAD